MPVTNLQSVSISIYFCQYLELLRQAKAQRYIWEEIRDVKEIRFRFQDKRSPAVAVRQFVAKMHVSGFFKRYQQPAFFNVLNFEV